MIRFRNEFERDLWVTIYREGGSSSHSLHNADAAIEALQERDPTVARSTVQVDFGTPLDVEVAASDIAAAPPMEQVANEVDDATAPILTTDDIKPLTVYRERGYNGTFRILTLPVVLNDGHSFSGVEFDLRDGEFVGDYTDLDPANYVEVPSTGVVVQSPPVKATEPPILRAEDIKPLTLYRSRDYLEPGLNPYLTGPVVHFNASRTAIRVVQVETKSGFMLKPEWLDVVDFVETDQPQ